MRYFAQDIEVMGQTAGLTAYLRSPIEAQPGRRRPAVLICPGGAYARCSDREGEPVAIRFLEMGCQAFVLSYSVAPARFPASLCQLAKAVALVRSHAEQWQIDPDRVFVCGFSAGGHLAASLGTFFDRPWLLQLIGASEKEIRPSGLLLAYPVISTGSCGHQESIQNLLGADAGEEDRRSLVSLEKQVHPGMPPVFLWHTFEDRTVPVENSLLFAEALAENRVSLELHIYPVGRHGISLADEETDKPMEDGCLVPRCQSWIDLARTWIKAQ